MHVCAPDLLQLFMQLVDEIIFHGVRLFEVLQQSLPIILVDIGDRLDLIQFAILDLKPLLGQAQFFL